MQLKAGVGPEEQKRFEAYSIQGAVGYETAPGGRLTTAATLMTGIQELVPGAKLMIDANSDKLIAWASPEEHEMLKAAVENLAPASGEDAPQLQVHMLKKRAPDNLVDGLKKLAPRAEISIDSELKRLTVVGNAADQQAVQAAIDKIQSGGGEDGEPYFEIYPVSGIPASNDQLTSRGYSSSRYFASRTFADQIEPFAPNAEITVDYEKGNLLVLGTAKEHAAIKAAIAKLQAGGQNTPELQIYTLKNDVPETLAEGLAQLVPHAKITINVEARQISVVATAADHKTVKETLDKIETAAGEKEEPYLMVYPTGDADSTTLTQILTNLAPKANVVVDSESESLAVFAVEKDQETVRSAIESMAITAMGAGKPMAMTYTLKKIPVASATQILTLAVPAAQTATGGDPQQLIVWANAKDQATVKATLEAVDVESPEGSKQTAAVYALEGINPNYSYYSLRLIREAVPNASMTLGADPTQVVVWATPKDHETIKQLVKSIIEQPPELTPVMEIYTLEKVDALVAIKILQGLVHDAVLSVGSNAGQLVAWARPKDQQTIKDALAKLTEADASPTAPTMEIYKLESGDAPSAMTILAGVAPEAQLSVGTSADQLIAWARPADHVRIKEAVAKIDAAGPKPTMKIYTLEKLEALSVTQMLKSIVPEAVCSIGANSRQLVVWATEEDHAEVDNAIQEMSADTVEGKAPMAVTYQLESLTATTAEQVLKGIAPNAKFTVGRR